ncbi:MAG: class I SAM-dependent methyltransferase [Patescibacteria group bacterium]|nr:class I SAM-dependent methyltransferase [Patescibacteria group bacterium]
MRQWSREQIEVANKVYHRHEAELYDERHPEIFASEAKRWSDYFEDWDKSRQGQTVILDIGAGTGFIYSLAESHLKPGDRFIASDLSPEMLEICRKRVKKQELLELLVAPADKLPLPDSSVDLVTVNSVLHHLPDPPAFLKEVIRVLKPGGRIVIMHEPNMSFAGSWIMRNIARLTSRLAMMIDKTDRGSAIKRDYSHIYQAVNDELLERQLIPSPLEPRQIQSMVDIHSPTAGGSYEELGFSLDYFLEHDLRDWKIIKFETYNFLGKLDPTTKSWRRVLNGMLKALMPNKGSSFSLVMQKPL